MILKLYTDNPSAKVVDSIVDILRSGGVIAYPTDSVYAFGAALSSNKGVEKLKAIKGKKETALAIVCSDLSHLSDYARIDNQTFRILRKNLPGPFTFILEATSKTPDRVMPNRRTIGVRVPNCTIALAIIEALGEPLITTSINDPEQEYLTDPSLIEERYRTLDAVVDGGYGRLCPTTVVDLSNGEIEIIRQSEAVLQ